ncbi:hypothetical protein D3C81_2260820 [compost metagenome]
MPQPAAVTKITALKGIHRQAVGHDYEHHLQPGFFGLPRQRHARQAELSQRTIDTRRSQARQETPTTFQNAHVQFLSVL